MTCWFVSRHPGAVSWMKSLGVRVDCWVQHIDVDMVCPGDLVIGTLPVHLAGQVCAKGARFMVLEVDMPEFLRGAELDMTAFSGLNPRLTEYLVQRVESR